MVHRPPVRNDRRSGIDGREMGGVYKMSRFARSASNAGLARVGIYKVSRRQALWEQRIGETEIETPLVQVRCAAGGNIWLGCAL